MLNRLRIRNFKSIAEAEVVLSPITVFVGPNGSGKRSMLDAIYFASRRIDEARKNLKRPGPDTFYRRGAVDPLILEGHLDSGLYQYRTESSWSTVTRTGGDGVEAEVRRFASQVHLKSRNSDWVPFSESSSPLMHNIAVGTSAVLLKFERAKLARPSYSHRVRPRVEYDGDGLATTLAYIKLQDAPLFAQIVGELRHVVPSVLGVHLRRERVKRIEKQALMDGESRVQFDAPREYIGDALAFDTSSGKDISADQISEGTLLALGILTVLLGPRRPRCVLLDDIDRGLHPTAQRQLLSIIREIMKTSTHRFQIMATSHSPFILNELTPNEIRITSIDELGQTNCASITEHPEYDRWKESMAPGEFWSLIGEKWVPSATADEVTR